MIDALDCFFHACLGPWDIERTYHYLPQKVIERSHTQFVVEALTEASITQVFADNNYVFDNPRPAVTGFQLTFTTVSERGEQVSQSLNAVFVPRQISEILIEGDYLRDRAYEEARPLVSHFRFTPAQRQLIMTTPYTRVIAVDSITLMNPRLRLRQIVNYRREGDSPAEPLLIGFGVEQKVD